MSVAKVLRDKILNWLAGALLGIFWSFFLFNFGYSVAFFLEKLFVERLASRKRRACIGAKSKSSRLLGAFEDGGDCFGSLRQHLI